jgi:S1-C subfamily serine protease
VKVKNPADDQTGSGVVVRTEKARDGSLGYALTAAHVVPTARAVDVVISGTADKPGKVLKAEVLARSEKADLAVLRFPTDDGTAVIPVAPPHSEPQAVVSVGWVQGVDPTVLDETLRGKVRLRRPGAKDTVLCWEAARKQARGRSGGPLVDESGRLVGVASGHDGEFGYYVHADEVREFLKASGLKFVFEDR